MSAGKGLQGMDEQEQIAVAVVDDHGVLVDALSLYIEAQEDMDVAGRGGSCADCLAVVRRCKPQVLILDVNLPDGDGIELVPLVKEISPETNILILTSLSDEATMVRAMQVGVSGFIPKSRSLPDVIHAVRKAAAGEIVMPSSLLVGLLNRSRPQERPARERVTVTLRELEILNLLAVGKTAEEIAASLTITTSTARTHIRNLMHKLGVRSQLQAVTYALKHGLIDPPV